MAVTANGMYPRQTGSLLRVKREPTQSQSEFPSRGGASSSEAVVAQPGSAPRKGEPGNEVGSRPTPSRIGHDRCRRFESCRRFRREFSAERRHEMTTAAQAGFEGRGSGRGFVPVPKSPARGLSFPARTSPSSNRGLPCPEPASARPPARAARVGRSSLDDQARGALSDHGGRAAAIAIQARSTWRGILERSCS